MSYGNAPRVKKQIEICAKCGKTKKQAGGLCKSYFIPRNFAKQIFMTRRMSENNSILLCSKCKGMKANKIVLPEWYECLPVYGRRRFHTLFNKLKNDLRDYILENYEDYSCDEITELEKRLGKLITEKS